MNRLANELQKLMNMKVEPLRQCGCIGPQNGEPLCPCAMKARGVFKRDGRWIEPEHDLGPVR